MGIAKTDEKTAISHTLSHLSTETLSTTRVSAISPVAELKKSFSVAVIAQLLPPPVHLGTRSSIGGVGFFVVGLLVGFWVGFDVVGFSVVGLLVLGLAVGLRLAAVEQSPLSHRNPVENLLTRPRVSSPLATPNA